MKKIAALVASVLLVFSLCTVTACDSNSDEYGVIGGTYKEVSAEEINNTIEDIVDKSSEEEAQQGVNLGVSTNLDYTFGMASSLAYSVEYSGKAVVDYKLSMSQQDENVALAGVGDISLTQNTSMSVAGASKQTSTEYNLKVYNDSQYLYFQALQGGENKGKIDFMQLIGAADEGIMPDFGEIEAPSAKDTLDIIAKLDEYSVKTYLDVTDGVKIKISVTEQTVKKLLAELLNSMAGSEEIPTETAELINSTVNTLTFTAMKCDFYLALNKSGQFVKFSEDMDIAFSIDLSGLTLLLGANLGTISVGLSGGVEVKIIDETVTIPENIATDDTFIDYTSRLGELY